MRIFVFVLFLIPAISIAQNVIVKSKVKFLALGDSYTIGESVPVKDRWPVQLIDALVKAGLECSDPKIIATTGWRTDDLRNAILNAKPSNDYTLVSLLIGVNNFYQGRTVESFKPEFEELLQMAIALAGSDKTKVFVVSIPDYGYTPFGKSFLPSISKAIDEYNNASASITHKHSVAFINITDISRRGLDEPSLVAGDGLHPSGKMYLEWVNRILNSLTIDRSSTEQPSDDDGQGSVPENDQDPVTGVLKETVDVRVYPNPFNTALIFDNLPSVTRMINLFDSKGQQVFARQLNAESKFILETAQFASGMYHYQIVSRAGALIQGNIIKSY